MPSTAAPPIDQLLYEGESVLETLSVGDGELVATTHRVLAFGTVDGARVRVCQRANVDSVDAEMTAAARWLSPGIKALVVGAILAGAGATVSLDGFASAVDVSGAGGGGAVGLGGLLQLFSLLQTALVLLDDMLLVGGLFSFAGGLAAVGLYVQSRESIVRVSVAGEEDLVVSGDVDEPAIRAFRNALRYE